MAPRCVKYASTAFTSKTFDTFLLRWRHRSEKPSRSALIPATWPRSASSTKIDFYVRPSALNLLGPRFRFERFFAPETGADESCAVFYETGKAQSMRYSK